jgi:hypothetical protein
MSTEDDFDDIMNSPDETSGQADTSEPPVEDESVQEVAPVTGETVPAAPAAVEAEEVKPAPKRKTAAKKKKKAVAKPKAKAKVKAKAKKKAAKPAAKPAAKKTAKKKTRPAAKKKKATGKARRKR